MSKSRHLLTVVALLATGTVVSVAAQQFASADVSSGDRPVLVQITPCRLADTRPDSQVGPRGTKLGAAQTVEFDTQDTTTQCAGQIPSDATSLSTNITAVGASENSFLTIWEGGTRPLAASLNPAPGEPPTPNGVVTKLSSDQKFLIYNNLGSVDVVIDVNGYYVNHNHDDLYQPGGDATVSVGAAAFHASSSAIEWRKNLRGGTSYSGAWITSNTDPIVPSSLAAPVQLPHGSTITQVTAYFEDKSPVASLTFHLRCEKIASLITRNTLTIATADTVANPAFGQVALPVASWGNPVDNEKCAYFVIAEGDNWVAANYLLQLRGFVITTT